MVNVNIHEAKTHLSKLLQRVSTGEEVIISKSGKPLARLVPFNDIPPQRVSGQDRDLFMVADNFDESLPPSTQKLFES